MNENTDENYYINLNVFWNWQINNDAIRGIVKEKFLKLH